MEMLIEKKQKKKQKPEAPGFYSQHFRSYCIVILQLYSCQFLVTEVPQTLTEVPQTLQPHVHWQPFMCLISEQYCCSHSSFQHALSH